MALLLHSILEMVLHKLLHPSPNTEADAVHVSHQASCLQPSTATPVINRDTGSWRYLEQ